MEEVGGGHDKPRLGFLRGRAAAIVASAGILVGIGTAAEKGYFNGDIPKDTTPSQEQESNKELLGKPVINGKAISDEGEIITIDGLKVVNPKDPKIQEQNYALNINKEVSTVPLFESPSTNTTSANPTEFNITTNTRLIGVPVYGERYGTDNPDNILGHATQNNAEVGYYFRISQKNSSGENVDLFVPAAAVVVGDPITVLSINQ